MTYIHQIHTVDRFLPKVNGNNNPHKPQKQDSLARRYYEINLARTCGFNDSEPFLFNNRPTKEISTAKLDYLQNFDDSLTVDTEKKLDLPNSIKDSEIHSIDFQCSSILAVAGEDVYTGDYIKKDFTPISTAKYLPKAVSWINGVDAYSVSWEDTKPDHPRTRISLYKRETSREASRFHVNDNTAISRITSIGNLLVAGTINGHIHILDPRASSVVKSWKAHPRLCQIAQPRKDHILASSGKDGTVKIWDIRAVEMHPTLSIKNQGPVRALQWDPRGSYLALAADTNKSMIQIFDPQRNSVVETYQDQEAVKDFMWSKDGQLLTTLNTLEGKTRLTTLAFFQKESLEKIRDTEVERSQHRQVVASASDQNVGTLVFTDDYECVHLCHVTQKIKQKRKRFPFETYQIR